MLTIPIAIYLIGLALVLQSAFRRAGAGVGRLALRRSIIWTAVWALLFVIYLVIAGLGHFGT